MPAEREIAGHGLAGGSGVGQRDDLLPFLPERLLDAFDLPAIERLRVERSRAQQRHRGDGTCESRWCVHACQRSPRQRDVLRRIGAGVAEHGRREAALPERLDDTRFTGTL